MARSRTVRTFVGVAAALVSVLPGLVEAAPAAGPKQVLALYATRRDSQIAAVVDAELPRRLGGEVPGSLDYYTEYLDLARFPEPGYQAALRDFLRRKYRDLQFDLVITMHDVALDFVTANRAELFPDAPIVFVSTNPRVVRPPNSTGVIAPVEFAPTLTLAAALQPGVRQVVVVTGADRRDAAFERLARQQFAALEPRFAFSYLAGLATPELERRLAALPSDAIVYYVLVNRDGHGDSFHPLEYLDRVTAAASVPVYCWVDSAIGRGILGGSLKSQSLQTAAVETLARRVLGGERADAIAPVSPDLNVAQIDWRQLRRWGISDTRVPAGTVVLFKNPSIWERYKVYILGGVGLLLLQSALIAGLLVQLGKRRKAEDQVRGREGDLRASYVRIRDLAGRLLVAEERERARIARELHDDLSQQLARLCSDLELLSGLSEGESGDIAFEALHRAHVITTSLRDLSHQLHPAMLRVTGLVPSLQALQAEMGRSGLAVELEHDSVPPTLPPAFTLSVYRVVQEALQNAARHSRARVVRVRLRGSAGTLALTVSDDGVGFEPRQGLGHGLGLVSIRERIEALGGRLDIHSAPGAGTRVEIAIPLAAASGTGAALAG